MEIINLCPCSSFQSTHTGKSDDPEAQRKVHILSTVSRTEEYLQNRHIPDFIQFLLTKLLSETPENPLVYLDNLLDDCMLFRAGLGNPPVLYENRFEFLIIYLVK